MSFFLAADQGGTKTQVAVFSADGTIIGTACGDGADNYYYDPENKSSFIVRQLADDILTRAGIARSEVTAAVSGVMCFDWAYEEPIHRGRLQQALQMKDITVFNDSIIALRAGSNARNRCIICAGTGLNLAAQTENGKEFIYGCYIPMRIMGGLALGGAVIDAVREAYTGVRPPTVLTQQLLAHTGFADVESLFIHFTTTRYDIEPQHLVPGLKQAYLAGDGAAKEIINNFTNDLTAYTRALLNRMDLQDADTELVFSGGIFKGDGSMIADKISHDLAKEFAKLRFVNARLEPVCGAMLIGLDRYYNNDIPKEVLDRLEEGYGKWGLYWG
jgi:N-acetylglucosamine kinase-like BadF-type ATPase